MSDELGLNRRAADRLTRLLEQADRHCVTVRRIKGTPVIDCGVEAAGGLEAGIALAETCLAGLGQVELQTSGREDLRPMVRVFTDQPIAACMASQYAGWQISEGDYFAMGSGPMRAVAGHEPLFAEPLFGSFQAGEQKFEQAVGVLESGRLPNAEVCEAIARRCGVAPERLLLAVAPTASLAGTIQVVSRTVETAMHKLHELGYPLERIRSGFGAAPLPIVAADDLEGIGRTNDAVLYAGQVTLWVHDEDESLEAIGPQVPSNASSDHGRPFREIFERYQGDFYAIDPALFSPAVVQFVNLKTGRAWRFGELVELPESGS